MSKVMQIILTLLLMTLSLNIYGEIYEYKDQNGNRVFSDRPPTNASMISTITLDQSQINSIPQTQSHTFTQIESLNSIQKQMISSKKVTTANIEFKKINILSPTDQQTFWNERQISVEISTTFEFSKEYMIKILLDGKSYEQSATKTKFTLDNISRGSHTLQAELLNSTGELLCTSQTITFFVHYGSVKNESIPNHSIIC